MNSDTAVQGRIGTSGSEKVEADSGGLSEARGGQARLTLRKTDEAGRGSEDGQPRTGSVELGGDDHLLTMAVDRTERQRILQELERTNNSLRAERAMLENKNIALKEIMEQIDQYKRSTSQQLQANVNRVIRPMLQLLTDKLPPADRRLVSLIDSTLQDLIDPFVGKLESLSHSLTPREMEVCHMVRNGFSSKQIASLLNVSVFTVNNQRRSIRRKLKIADGETHLESYLKLL